MTSYLLLTLDTLVFFLVIPSFLNVIRKVSIAVDLFLFLLFTAVSDAFLSFFYPTIVRDTIAWSTLLLLSLLVAEERMSGCNRCVSCYREMGRS